ncbi:carbohydrate diacid transcriptional activator CdaR [uncultured Roseburia sp.]|uniref:Helix-turn-helix domain-containing protein n=1 Tax=Brotonthovivens ammoniilytica TaxID=2981725 RepID=A0ABT2TH02_9FIRM|nr:helix-turn-helix domain-containing protein [Brotonthovivens ammoniilytica]MCU6761458.1 helix-turn-helix domain-containing protein [Brotonthovivens ammoniilytica]SCI29019.1 carbohydrate diacid transcriptional activator CdaR [uncultured Roseburia sp.]
MKLSMWIFAGWLKEFQPKPDIQLNLFEIEAVRLFSSDVTPAPNTMYIGRLCDLFTNGNDRVICVHNNDVLRLNTSELDAVLNCVLNALAFYTSWDNTMMNLLTSGAMLQDLVDASEDVLNNPLFILDSGQRHLAHNQKYQKGDVDELWDYLLEEGSCHMDFLIQFNQFDPQRLTRKGIYSYDQPVFPNNAYHYNFLQENNFFGSATYIDLSNNVSQDKIDCFKLFCNYIDRWFQIHIQEQQSLILDTQIHAAISDAHGDSDDLCRRLILYGWQETDPLIFFKLDAPYQPFNINKHLCHTLNMNFSNLYAITTDLSICLLCNLNICTLEETKKSLLPWLQSSKYYATAGQPFFMKESFYNHYQYVSKTSEFVQKQIGQIYDGKQYAFPYILSEMHHTILPDILHPVLETLKTYDTTHHTEFYETLYVYLKNDRSIADTAKEMNLHRNTLIYRLKRLKELTDSSLDDYMARLHILLSYEIEFSK